MSENPGETLSEKMEVKTADGLSHNSAFLLSTDGPQHNVIKIKPPLVVGAADLDAMLEALSETLDEAPLGQSFGPGGAG